MSEKISEFEIPVPWGSIAVKAWGEPRNSPILAVHGIQDNAGTFDRLIPLLPKSYYYVCVDLPGHGKSSHFPKHMLFRTMDCVLALKFVLDYFQWSSVIFMGHSLGCHVGMYLAFIYPEIFSMIIALDAITSFPVDARHFSQYFREKFERYMEITEKISDSDSPSYTFEEAVDRIMTRRPTAVNREAAIVLVKRMLVPNGENKFKFSLDQRLKNMVRESVSTGYLTRIVRKAKLRIPHLIILSSESKDLSVYLELKPVVDEFKKNKYFQLKVVEGNHDVHNNTPELVAPIVSKFLSQTISKL